jgi:hypothetical protein
MRTIADSERRNGAKAIFVMQHEANICGSN